MSDTRNGRLDDDVVNKILDEYLTPVNALDPIVRTFISAYVSYRHVGDASRATGITKAQGNRLLNRRDINNAIKAIGNESARKYGFDATEIVERINEIVQLDIIEIFNDDGTVKQLDQLSPEARRAIKKFQVEEKFEYDMNGVKTVSGRLVSVELYDKMKGTELLGKESGLFKDTVKHEHTYELGANAASVLLGSVDKAAKRIRDVTESDPERKEMRELITGPNSGT